MTVTPAVQLTGPIQLDPDRVLQHALEQYRSGVVVAASDLVAKGPLDYTADILAATILEVAGGHLNLLRITAGVAFKLVMQRSRERNLVPVDTVQVSGEADEAALNMGSYMASTSANAVMEGYHRYVNAGMPPKEAARRAVRAFGLTTPQMRTLTSIKETPVKSSEPGAFKSKIEGYIRRAFSQRVKTIISNSVRQVEHDSIQSAWEAMVADGTLSETALKVWFTAEDERTCPICAPMDKHAVSVMDTFRLPDGNKVKAPPVHVNCRCTTELLEQPIAKAWDPQKHPRQDNGEFGRKTAPVGFKDVPELNLDVSDVEEPKRQGLKVEQPLNVGRKLAADVATNTARVAVGEVNWVREARKVTTGKPQAKTRVVTSGVKTNRAQTKTASTNRTAPMAVTFQAPTPSTGSITIGTRQVALTNLNVERRIKMAQNINAIQQGLPPERKPVLPHNVYPLGPNYIAFATMADLNADDGDMHGKMHPMKPLRFVNHYNQLAIDSTLNQVLAPLDKYFRDHDVDAPLEDVENAPDDQVRHLGLGLRQQVEMSGHKVKGELVVSIAPEDASSAWRNLLKRQNGEYEAVVYDSLDPEWEGKRLMADSATIASLSANQSRKVGELLPEVIIAPHGTWNTESGVGATTTMSSVSDEHDVSGPFLWERRPGGIIQITPDKEAYERANPEQWG